MLFIGIDPGKSGAIAVVDRDAQVHSITKNTETLHDLSAFLKAVASYHECRAMIEKVSAMPGQGVTSMFTFGRSYGNLEALLAAHLVPFEHVLPYKWQTGMKCRTKGDKNVSKARAQELFPSTRITHAIADALLIAEYCRKSFLNE